VKKLVRWLWILPAVALLYAGVTLWLRRAENREIESRARIAEAEADRAVVDRVGGGELKVLSFYANPPVVRRGAKGLLCYGVAGAEKVQITPPVGEIAPSLSRCVDIAPTSDTKYRLTAVGRGSEAASETVVRVR
jgi:hypothetical protein